MSEYPSSERLPITSWEVDDDALEQIGIRPGVYRHFKGGEYITLTVGWRMSEEGAKESV